jgi:hypothetical protein
MLVLEHILICAAPLSLAPGGRPFKPDGALFAPGGRSRRLYFRPLGHPLRLCYFQRCNGSLAVASDISALWGVSQQLRSEAQDIFFSRNRWVLHIASCNDGVSWISDHWGEEALRMMSDIRIVAQSVNCAHLQLVRTRLEKFVDTLISGNKLRRLAVQWIWGPEESRLHTHVQRLARDHDFERQADGTRGLKRIIVNTAGKSSNNPYAGYVGGGCEEWVENEKVLTPLHKLKGIQARIEGCVTDEWARWLEKSMAATQGPIGEFVRTKNVKQAEMEMMEAIRLKNRWEWDWLLDDI